MKIAIDVSQVAYGTGVASYTKNLVKALLKIDKKNDYILFGYSLRLGSRLKDFEAELKPSKNFNFKFLFPSLHLRARVRCLAPFRPSRCCR